MSNFVDESTLCVRAGNGGAGCVSFRRESHTPRGGPDGGDGGSGGDVWLVADHNVASLLAFRDHPHRIATNGTHGSGRQRHGHRGDDLLVPVPEGTSVLTREGVLLADLVHHGDRWLAARGGVGGKGNSRFLSNRRRAPAFAEQGEIGEEHWIRLELKLMADVALVGLPNVGKSTLISAMSNARPRIADYPFTTLEPNLGVVRTDDGFEMIVADIPGLVDGAAEGRGLGDRFLRHIERARVLLLCLDAGAEFGLGLDDTTVARQEEILLDELCAYRPDLVARPRVRALMRTDLVPTDLLADIELFDDEPTDGPDDGDDGTVRGLLDDIDGEATPTVAVSGVTRAGIGALVGALRPFVEASRTDQRTEESYVVYRPDPEGVRIERTPSGAFEVVGRDAVRAVALNDLTDLDALAEVRRRLDDLGVSKALVRAGVRDGDDVIIGAFNFTYESDTTTIMTNDDDWGSRGDGGSGRTSGAGSR